MRGELAPESALPSERALSDALAVNRGAVREAIKRLQQAGLVAVRHGGNHVVRDFEAEGGLELLPSLLIDKHGRLDATVLRSIMAMRSALAPDIAAGAAERNDPALLGLSGQSSGGHLAMLVAMRPTIRVMPRSRCRPDRRRWMRACVAW